MTLSAFPDYDEGSLERLRTLTARLEGAFQTYGYARVEPPAIDLSDTILERSGEETRRRAYLFDDPHGNELCLRPELTIPVCRLALRHGLLNRTAATRLSYAGPVFRHETPGHGRFGQFHQAGIELLGGTDPVAAEAEIVALAIDAARAGGIDDTLMLMGDVRFFRTLLDHYPLPERLKLELKRDFMRLDPDQGRARRSEAPSAEQRTLMQSVAAIGKDQAVTLIESFLSVAEINRIGTRGIDEIVERMIDNAEDQLTRIPDDIAAQMRAFLDIEGEPREALEDIADFGRAVGLRFDPMIDEFHRRIDLMDAYGIDMNMVSLCTGLQRDIDYYTGFIFEIAHDNEAGIWPLGGGGRYDNLIGSLDAEQACPATGFALGMERMLMAREPGLLSAPVTAEPALQARIIVRSRMDGTVAAEAARVLRDAGWRVAVELGPPDADPARLARTPYLIVVGPDNGGRPTVVVQSQAENKQFAMDLAELGAFAEKIR